MIREETKSLRTKIALCCKILAKECSLIDFLGHVSSRIPGSDLILISPSLKGLANIMEEDILTISLDGKVVEGTSKPPSEIFLHLQIYKVRDDVKSIVHVHPKYATLLSITGKEFKVVHHLGVPFIDGVPVFEEYGLIDNDELAHKIASTLGDKRAVLLRNHGVLVVGRSVEEACILTIWLEKNCELQLISESLGSIRSIPLERKSELLREHYLSKTVKTAWNYYLSCI